MPAPLGRPSNKLRADIPHALKPIEELTMFREGSYLRRRSLLQPAWRERCRGRVAGAVFLAGLVATVAFGTSLATAAPKVRALGAEGP